MPGLETAYHLVVAPGRSDNCMRSPATYLPFSIDLDITVLRERAGIPIRSLSVGKRPDVAGSDLPIPGCLVIANRLED